MPKAPGLTGWAGDGYCANTRARLVRKLKDATLRGGVLEIREVVVWEVPTPVRPCLHLFKYRAVFVVDGERVFGFDNERGKGDHLHRGAIEAPYRFVSPAQLIADFDASIRLWRLQHG